MSSEEDESGVILQTVLSAKLMSALPQEVVLAIHRVLELQPEENDELESLSNFSPMVTLNGYFPDEASLGQLEIVRTKLASNERDLQREIDSLQEELRRDQDPGKMVVIQEMISVRRVHHKRSED